MGNCRPAWVGPYPVRLLHWWPSQADHIMPAGLVLRPRRTQAQTPAGPQGATMSRIDAHVGAVQRKLALGIFLDWLMKVLAILAALAIVIIVAQRLIHFGLRAEALYIGLGVGLLAAIVLTIINRPTRTAAAVALDEKLGLKEKFSTALTLRKTKS